jgi:hypothetical protein
MYSKCNPDLIVYYVARTNHYSLCRNEILAERGFKRDSPTSPPRRMTPAERDSGRRHPSSGRQQDENGEFIAEDDSLTDNAAIERPFEDPDGM